MKIDVQKILFFLLILALILGGFDLFWGLNHWPLMEWDESRHGVSALEMLDQKNYLVNTFAGKPDYWNVKPPLSFLSIIGSVLLFGKSIWAIRLPSALFGAFLLLLTAFMMLRRYGVLAALTSVSLLISCGHMFLYHGFRSADADALYLLFFISGVFLLAFKPDSLLALAGAAFLAALVFLTKSFHVFAMAPAFFILYVLRYQEKSLTFSSLFWPFLCFVLPVGLWALLRYHADGTLFFQKMISLDLQGRFSEHQNSHSWLYLNDLVSKYIVMTLTLLGLLWACFKTHSFKNLWSKDFLIVFGTAVMVLFFYALAKVKHNWYIYPSVFLFCVSAGMIVSQLNRKFALIGMEFAYVGMLVMLVFMIYPPEIEMKLPVFYQQLAALPEEKYPLIVVPKDLYQSERLAIMVMNSFTAQQIQENLPKRPFILMKRTKGEMNIPPKCALFSSGPDFNFYVCSVLQYQ